MPLPRRIARRVHRLFGSELDHVIAPEIKDDLLYAAIVRVASTLGVRQMLEIGSSSGDGSTEAFVTGALANPDRPMLHCIEVSASRHAALVKRHAGQSFVHCYHTSSVGLGGFASAADVEQFYRGVGSGSWRVSLKEILAWLEQDVRYASSLSVAKGGIRMIKDQHGIDHFDAVLIDGSEFTGTAELAEVYGSRFLLLDDICTFKNHANFHALCSDDAYRVLESGDSPRNGYALFERVASL